MHWDLMLEARQVLQTYRLGLPPEVLLQKTATAVKIFDHPQKFLTYEGIVNNGKGSVQIVEAGTSRLLSGSKNRRELQLDGKFLKGKFLENISFFESSWNFRMDLIRY